MFRILFLTLLLAPHPVHVSLMSLDYAGDRKVFSMFIMVYFDDFILDSRVDTSVVKNLDFSGSDALTGKILSEYVNEKVRISVNNKTVRAELLENNLSDNELRMFLSFSSPGKARTVMVRSGIMTSIYNDQTNMIIVKADDFEEGAKLTAEEPEKTFIIE